MEGTEGRPGPPVQKLLSLIDLDGRFLEIRFFGNRVCRVNNNLVGLNFSIEEGQPCHSSRHEVTLVGLNNRLDLTAAAFANCDVTVLQAAFSASFGFMYKKEFA